MEMIVGWLQDAAVLIPIMIGAVAGAVPTAMIERMRNRAALDTRWDSAIQRTCADFAACARTILDLTEHHDPEIPDVPEATRREHSRLQVLMAEVRILGDEAVQLAARRVVRHAWALQVETATGTDPRAADHPSLTPRERLLGALFDFYRAARRQLRVPAAAELIPLNPPDEVVLR
ncbi:hypothetical protein [Actinoplanes sp. NPDC020271]|uniref:hypothetical protein n=1 Tax=Actinoplanes sp. NPDC020271 TaxID=3363896 RepID=UPI0037A9896D